MAVIVLFVLYAVVLSIALARFGHRTGVGRPPGAPVANVTRVLVVGATGGTGRQLVAQALERGFVVTTLVRDPSKLAMVHERLKVVQRDVRQLASLETALKGQDAVLCALGHKRYFYPTRILSEGTRNYLRARETQGVARLICETSLGIGDGAGRMGLYYKLFVIPLILPLYFWEKRRQERIIERSEAEWTIVRPGALTKKSARGQVRHGRRVGSFLHTVRVPRADVSAFMLDQLASNTCLRAAPGVA